MFPLNTDTVPYCVRKVLNATRIMKINLRKMFFFSSGEPAIIPAVSESLTSLNQADIDSMADNMKIYFDVLSPNTVQITLYNKGSSPITRGEWAVYVCMLGVLDYDHLANNPKGYVLPGGSNLKLTHINGCLYKLEPLDRFKPFASGQHIKLKFNSSFVRARTDLAPNWYVAAEGLMPKIIANTAGEDLSFVFSSNKWTWDPFRAKSVPDLGHAPNMLIPTPREIPMVDKTRKVILSAEWCIYEQMGLENEAKYLTGTGFFFISYYIIRYRYLLIYFD